MNRVYRFYVDCGRSGSLSGLFAVNDKGQAKLDHLISEEVTIYFGEVLGKH